MNPILESLQKEIASALDGLTTDQTQLHPRKSPDKWSIQQIIQHLCLTYRSTGGVIESRLKKGRPTQTAPKVTQRIGQFLVTKLAYFPSGHEAPSVVVPPSTPLSPDRCRSGVGLHEELSDELTRMGEILEKAERQFGSRRCATHSVLGPMSISQWRAFHLVHGRHHVKQILAIRRERGV
jgi:DinB superfamily